jgi:hypothetical protein
MEQTILIAAKPKSRKLTPEEREQRNQAEKEKQQRILDRKAQENNNNPKYCKDILNDVRAILDGNGKVNNLDEYKYIEEGVTKYLVGDDPKRPLGYVKSSLDSRVRDLKVDKESLYDNHRTRGKAHPTHGSYEGHQHTLDNQKKALKRALGKLDDNCKDYPLTAEQQKLKDRAEAALAAPTPQEPDSKTRQNSAAAIENQALKGIINSIPLLNQEQKNAVGNTLNGIQKVVDKGQDYWNKQGKQQVIDTLTTVAKIPIVIAVVIVAAIANAFGFESPLRADRAGSSNDTATAQGKGTTIPKSPETTQPIVTTAANPTNPAAVTNSVPTDTKVAATNQNPERTTQLARSTTDRDTAFIINNPTATANTGKQDTAFIIPTATANTGKQDTAFIIPTATANTGKQDTAFIINNPTGQNTALTGGKSTTALTGGNSTTALTRGETQQPSQLQQ